MVFVGGAPELASTVLQRVDPQSAPIRSAEVRGQNGASRRIAVSMTSTDVMGQRVMVVRRYSGVHIESVSEVRYAREGGVWARVWTRHTTMDSTGVVRAVAEQSLSSYRVSALSAGKATLRRGRVLLGSVSRACGGFVLPSAANADDDPGCAHEVLDTLLTYYEYAIVVGRAQAYARQYQGQPNPCTGEGWTSPQCGQYLSIGNDLARALIAYFEALDALFYCQNPVRQPPPVFYCGLPGGGGPGGGENEEAPPFGLFRSWVDAMPEFVDTCATSGGGGGGPSLWCYTEIMCWDAYDASTMEHLWTWCGPTTVCDIAQT